MSRIENFSQLVEAIVALPVSHRRAALAIECDALAHAYLVDDMHAAGKVAAPKVAPPTKRKCKHGR